MVTIKDVSKLAGVSVGSVSKYLNGYHLKEKTTVAIEAAIKELNYEPNVYAKGLKTQRTNTVVLIIPSIWQPFFSELTYYIEKNLQAKGIKLILCDTGDNLEKEIAYFTMARQNKVDGIIAITYSNIDKYITPDLPVVCIDRYFSANTNFISSDNYAGGWLGAEELVKAGSTHLAYFGSGSSYQNDTKDRLEGFKAYCEQKQISYGVAYTEAGREAYEQTLVDFCQEIATKQVVDGVLTASDAHAWDIIAALDGKINIPADMNLVGFDGSRASRHQPIFLSSIRQDVPALAQNSVDILLKRIENKEEPIVHRKLPVTFIKGKTSR